MHKASQVETMEQLRRIIPSPNAMMDRRIQKSLDGYCEEFIRASRLAVLALSDPEMAFHIIPSDGVAVRMTSDSELELQLPGASAGQEGRVGSERQEASAIKQQASLYFIAPKTGHGLRVNGRVLIRDGVVSFTVSSAYFQCARAKARSGFWQSESQPDALVPDSFNPWTGQTLSPALNPVFAASPYLLLGTKNAQGETELSPRGDPAGFVTVLDETRLLLPERPGNKVAVSLSNILECPEVGVLMLIPGSDLTMQIVAQASVTTNPQWLQRLSVNGKSPKLAIVLEVRQWRLHRDAVLKAFWEKPEPQPELTSFSKVMAEHINGSGWLGKVSRPIVDVAVRHDMKNLY